MPTEPVTLPTGEVIPLTYWEAGQYFPRLGAIQSLRTGGMQWDSDQAKAYFTMAPFYAGQFATAIDPSWDAAATPPSSNDLATPYLDKVIERTNAKNISDRFNRPGKVKSSTVPPPTLQQVIAAISYDENGDEGSITSLLIVDDAFESGRTVAALLHHLRKVGLPKTCVIGAAAPIWVKA